MSTRSLQQAPYVSLTTFRKTGVGVATPVWAAERDGVFYVFSAGEAGKVKRLRNSGKASLARCTATGKLLDDPVDAEAELITSPEAIATALSALRGKYGWQMAMADIGARLTGKFNRRAYIAVRLKEA